MKNNIITLLFALFILSLVSSCAGNKTEGGEAASKGAKWGAGGGAVLGLALGAVTGDKKMMLAGAATGAVVGGASGAMYEYGQQRDDKRNKTLADAIAGSKSNNTTGQALANPLEGFIGEWQVNAWGLMPDGKRLTAKGNGKGILTAKNTAKLNYSDIKADGYEKILNGYAIINFDEKNGLSLSTYGADNELDVTFIGEYIAEQKKFKFYLKNSKSKDTVTGILKTDVRMEVRFTSNNLWIVETYTLIEGKDTQIQSYRFSKS
ncbi:MAG: glycine zipper domain-containing protein [Gammaproteobacteria bacterium]